MIEKYVEVPEGEIYTIAFGSGSETLLIIHGGPDWDHAYLRAAGEALATGRRVILFDYRGCGKSTRFGSPEYYGVDFVVKDIETILTAYDIDRCHLLGFSFGGRVALQFLEKFPERVAKLILASATAYPELQGELESWPEYTHRHTAEMKAFINHAFQKAEADGQEPARAMALKTLPLDVYDLSRLPEIEKVIAGITFSSEWMKAFRAGGLSRNKLDAAALLNRAKKPLLIIHGQKDMRFPVSAAKKLHEAVAQSQLVILENSGHLAHLENRQKWVFEVDRFMSMG